MYFTYLAEISSKKEFNSELLGKYEYLVIGRLGCLGDDVDQDALEAFSVMAQSSPKILYVLDKQGTRATEELARFYDEVLGKRFPEVEWDRPFLMLIKIEDILDLEPTVLTGRIVYIDDYLKLQADSSEESREIYQHSEAGYALREAHRAIEQESHPSITLNKTVLLKVIRVLWQIFSKLPVN